MSLMHRALKFASQFFEERRIEVGGELYLQRFYVAGSMPPELADLWNVDRPSEVLGFLPTIYLHCFHKPDADRDLHCHPWTGVGLILSGGYIEKRMAGNPLVEPDSVRTYFREMRPGMLQRVTPFDFHRVHTLLGEPTWTLFVVGEKVQTWGYWNADEKRFVPWREKHKDSNSDPGET